MGLLQRDEKSSGVGLYSSDGLINPPPGKIRFGVAKVLLVTGGGMMFGAYLATHLSIWLENFEAERRRLQAEAAEKRRVEGESRGLKDPEGAKKRMESKERAARDAGTTQGEGGMRWQVS